MEIKSVVKSRTFKRTFDSKYGTQYVFAVEMENGDTGEYNSTKQDPSNFIVGTEQVYTKEIKQNGNYTNVSLKPVKDQQSGFKAGGSKFNPFIQSLIVAQSSFSKAVDLVCAGKITIEQMQGAAEKLMAQQIESALKFKDQIKQEADK